MMLGLCLGLSLLAQLTIKVTAIPANTPANASIYVAGTFNNWAADNTDYILADNGDGTYQIVLTPAAGLVKFKFTRGSWETVEGNANGGFQADHEVQYNGGEQTVALPILSWEGSSNGGGTAAANVFILSDNFPIPQLNRSRRIWIYLPPDYATSGKYYPVLYMQDGQNLFDANTSFSGEWQVDEALNQLFSQGDQGIIVIGIDNGGASRLDEYTPWPNPSYGGGAGAAYVDFIVETLKPHIDSTFRTRPQREYTGIMGSSLGGLISMYAAIEHQDVFSKAGIFSPSFWFSEFAYSQVNELGKQHEMRIYFLAGENESASMVPDLNRMYNTLRSVGFEESELLRTTHADGQHSEWYWAREFPAAYQWLFANTLPTATEEPQHAVVKIAPNPADSMLHFSFPPDVVAPQFALYSMDGKLVIPRQSIVGKAVDVSHLKSGTYLCKLFAKKKLLESQKIVIVH